MFQNIFSNIIISTETNNPPINADLEACIATRKVLDAKATTGKGRASSKPPPAHKFDEKEKQKVTPVHGSKRATDTYAGNASKKKKANPPPSTAAI